MEKKTETQFDSIVKSAFKEAFDYLSETVRAEESISHISTASMNEELKAALLSSKHIRGEMFGLTGLAGHQIRLAVKAQVEEIVKGDPLRGLVFSLMPEIAAHDLSARKDEIVTEKNLVVPLTLVQFGYLIGLHVQKANTVHVSAD